LRDGRFAAARPGTGDFAEFGRGLEAGMVQHGGFYGARGRSGELSVRCLWKRVAEFDCRAGDDYEQYGAVEDDANGRHAEHGNSGYDE